MVTEIGKWMLRFTETDLKGAGGNFSGNGNVLYFDLGGGYMRINICNICKCLSELGEQYT